MTQIYKIITQSGICQVNNQEGTFDYPQYQVLHCITPKIIHFENGGHSEFENVIKEFLVPDNPIIDVSDDSPNVVSASV